MDISELNSLYVQGETVDNELAAEQRSNLLLVAGHHYSKRRTSRFWNQLRESENITRTQKIRLTKNHIQKITKTIINGILSYGPDVSIGPHNNSETDSLLHSLDSLLAQV